MRKRRLKEARGRGNQGDWVDGKKRYGEAPEHRDWNAEVERKKAEKKRKADASD